MYTYHFEKVQCHIYSDSISLTMDIIELLQDLQVNPSTYLIQITVNINIDTASLLNAIKPTEQLRNSVTTADDVRK